MEKTTCSDKVKDAYLSRMEDIINIYEGNGAKNELPDSIYEYGLCIDRVEAGTFKDQRAGYNRYQLSYGGPTEEFRLYDNGDIEFWYLDWYDGAKIDVTGSHADIIRSIVEDVL